MQTIPNVLDIDAIESLREWLPKGVVTGYADDESTELQFDAGVDGRLLLTTLQAGTGGTELGVIPMLTEIGGVAGYGPLLAYATMTSRKQDTASLSMRPFSREHWLQVRFSDSLSLRAGRLALPFGMRIPDHTQYTREDLGFDKWSQTYAVELDTYNDDWLVASAVFIGDVLYAPRELQERGGALTITRNLPGRASAGVSFLGASSRWQRRAAASIHARLRLWERSYIMGEAAAYRRWTTPAPHRQTGVAGFVRAGWFALESLDVFVELGGRTVAAFDELKKARYMAGANWQMLPWVELSPALLLEEDPETGLKRAFFGQVHVIY
jgi:hypothetical protein